MRPMRRWLARLTRQRERSRWRFTDFGRGIANFFARRSRILWPIPPTLNLSSGIWLPCSRPNSLLGQEGAGARDSWKPDTELWTKNSSILSEVTRRGSPDKTGGNRIAASVRIEAFEGSRWRLRRTRLVCVLNGVLVLRYCILTGIPPCRW